MTWLNWNAAMGFTTRGCVLVENTATSYRKEQAFKRIKTFKIGGEA